MFNIKGSLIACFILHEIAIILELKSRAIGSCKYVHMPKVGPMLVHLRQLNAHSNWKSDVYRHQLLPISSIKLPGKLVMHLVLVNHQK